MRAGRYAERVQPVVPTPAAPRPAAGGAVG